MRTSPSPAAAVACVDDAGVVLAAGVAAAGGAAFVAGVGAGYAPNVCPCILADRAGWEDSQAQAAGEKAARAPSQAEG